MPKKAILFALLGVPVGFLAKADNWLVFFGVTGNDSASDGILLRYYNNNEINGWFCNSDYTQARIGGLENTRVTAELKSGAMTLNGVAKTITTDGKPYRETSRFAPGVN